MYTFTDFQFSIEKKKQKKNHLLFRSIALVLFSSRPCISCPIPYNASWALFCCRKQHFHTKKEMITKETFSPESSFRNFQQINDLEASKQWHDWFGLLVHRRFWFYIVNSKYSTSNTTYWCACAFRKVRTLAVWRWTAEEFVCKDVRSGKRLTGDEGRCAARPPLWLAFDGKCKGYTRTDRAISQSF